MWQAIPESFQQTPDRKNHLERIRISAANNPSVGREIQEEQRLDTRPYTQRIGKKTQSHPSTRSCYRQCDILPEKLRHIRHTITPPVCQPGRSEEEPVCSGSTERIHRCVLAGKKGIGEQGIHHSGDSLRWKAGSTADIQRYPRSDVPLPSETDHYPLPHEKP